MSYKYEKKYMFWLFILSFIFKYPAALAIRYDDYIDPSDFVGEQASTILKFWEIKSSNLKAWSR
jgi:hypothetical protein